MLRNTDGLLSFTSITNYNIFFFRNILVNYWRILSLVTLCCLGAIHLKRLRKWRMHTLVPESISMMIIRYEWFIWQPVLYLNEWYFDWSIVILVSIFKDGINILECRLAKEYIDSGKGNLVEDTTIGGCTHMQVGIRIIT